VPCSTDLIRRHGWGELVEAGVFEESKALMALEASKQEFLSCFLPASFADLHRCPTASLATLKKYQGDPKTLVVVGYLIGEVVEFFNVGKSMSDSQIGSTARLILGNHWHLTVGELKLCFNWGMAGKFGRLYDRLDGGVLLEWIERYTEIRDEYAAEQAYNRHQIRTRQPEAVDPEGAEKLGAMARDLEAKFERRPASAPKPTFRTLEEWAKVTHSDLNELETIWTAEWAERGDLEVLDYETFRKYKVAQYLNEQRKQR
jgi:hypothetical protein